MTALPPVFRALAVETDRAARHRRPRRHPDVDELDGYVGGREGKLLAIRFLEGGSEHGPRCLAVRAVVGPGRQGHDQVEALAKEAAVGQTLEGCGTQRHPAVGQDCARLVFQPTEGYFQLRASRPRSSRMPTVATRSTRAGATSSPSADATPAEGGQTTRRRPIFSATE